jgi:hypothetical protein
MSCDGSSHDIRSNAPEPIAKMAVVKNLAERTVSGQRQPFRARVHARAEKTLENSGQVCWNRERSVRRVLLRFFARL